MWCNEANKNWEPEQLQFKNSYSRELNSQLQHNMWTHFRSEGSKNWMEGEQKKKKTGKGMEDKKWKLWQHKGKNQDVNSEGRTGQQRYKNHSVQNPTEEPAIENLAQTKT